MILTEIKYAIRGLSLGRLRKLDEWLHELIRRAEEEETSPREQTTDERVLDGKTYRLENIRCGKENCKCKRGKLHGPYWYSYSRVKGKLTSTYIGKRLPKSLEKKLRASVIKPTRRSPS